jgi:hypothetical protein
VKSRAATLILVLLLGGVAVAAGTEERPGTPQPHGVIRIRERAVLELRVPRGGRSAEARARDASETLAHVLELPGPDVVRTEPRQEGVTLLVGETPIVELTQEDASAIGTNDLSLYAAAAAQRLDAGLKAERRRLQIQDAVFSVSLAVFITLLAFLALRLVGGSGGNFKKPSSPTGALPGHPPRFGGGRQPVDGPRRPPLRPAGRHLGAADRRPLRLGALRPLALRSHP